MLADLGVSSMQIDNPDRGFSYKSEGPLDLRLNPKKGISAAERLKTISQDELQGMLIENADEPHAEKISRAIVSAIRKGKDISTTKQLQQIIQDTLSFIPKDKSILKKPYIGMSISGVSKADPNTVVQGYAPYLPLKLEQINENQKN